MNAIRIVMYAFGPGSGHLARINAIYKGFQRARIPCEFFACAPGSKYRSYLFPGIKFCERDDLPFNVDIFICDWRADDFVESLPRQSVRTWIGLRRLGKTKAIFPRHFHVVAIEPAVEGDVSIWPIIVTWPDELLSRDDLADLVGVASKAKTALLCENGAYRRHVSTIFHQPVPENLQIIRCSNSPYSRHERDLDYYPAAKLFRAVDYLVIGAGYNSVHEAMCYADLARTAIVKVGGDDQALRLAKMSKWERRKGPRTDELAVHLMNVHAN